MLSLRRKSYGVKAEKAVRAVNRRRNCGESWLPADPREEARQKA
jgi:hypothetical protein